MSGVRWRRVWVIARHAYVTNIRRAGFIIMTCIVPGLGVLGLLFGAFFAGQVEDWGNQIGRQFELGGKPVGVVDRSGYFSTILPEYQEDFILLRDEEQAEQALEEGRVSSVLLIGPDYLETGTIVAMSLGSSFTAAALGDSTRVRAFILDHLLAGQVEPLLRKRAVDPIHVQPRVLSSSGRVEGEGPLSFMFNFVVPYFLSLLFVMTVFVSSGYLLQSIAEEKESRVMEIVVSSVQPFELLAGKVAGLGALGLTQVLIWAVSGAVFSSGAVALFAVGGAVIPARVLILGVIYYLLGYTLYSVLMAGVGALGTTTRESQQLGGIFSLFAAIPYMLSGFLFTMPNAVLPRVLSYIPLTAPTMMMLRLPLAEVPLVDICGSILSLCVALPAASWAGTKLFRVGILIYDKRPSLREIGWVLRHG